MTARPTWIVRADPLPGAAVAGTGAAGERLADSARRRVRDGAALRIATGPGWVLVVGAEPDLPWADGAVFLGWDDGILAPTNRTTRPAPGAIRASLLGRNVAPDELVAVLPDAVLVTAGIPANR